MYTHMGIWIGSLLMEIMKAMGLIKVYSYLSYIWQVHPQLVYYGVMVVWWVVYVIYNVGVAHALGEGAVAGETVAAHMSKNFLVNNNYIGVKQVPYPYFKNTNIEGYQHVQVSAAFYYTKWHLDGWKYIPLRKNEAQASKLPDAMITNGIEVLPFQFKCTIGANFNEKSHISHMITYNNKADVLAITCLQQSAYIQASTYFLDKCVNEQLQQPEVLLTLLNASEQWSDLPVHTQQIITHYVALHKQQITQTEYDTHNNAMDAHTAGGGTPATLYTAHPNVEVKQQLITQLLANMKLLDLIKEGCLLSQHKLIYPE